VGEKLMTASPLVLSLTSDAFRLATDQSGLFSRLSQARISFAASSSVSISLFFVSDPYSVMNTSS